MIVFQTPESKKVVFDYYMSIVNWKSLTPDVRFSMNNDVFLLSTSECILKFKIHPSSNIAILDGLFNLEFQDYFGDVDAVNMWQVTDAIDVYAPYWSIRVYDVYRELWDDCLSKYKLFMIDELSFMRSRIYCSWLCYNLDKEQE